MNVNIQTVIKFPDRQSGIPHGQRRTKKYELEYFFEVKNRKRNVPTTKAGGHE